MSKNILSIDFTYFQRAAVEVLKNYPEDIDCSTFMSCFVWANHYLKAANRAWDDEAKSGEGKIPNYTELVQGVLARSAGIMGEEFMRLERILQAQPEDCPVLIANSQVRIYDFIHSHIQTSVHLNLYNLDMYHDLLDGKDTLNCRNWVMRIFSEYRVNLHWVANPVSLELHGFDKVEKMQDSLSKVVMPDLKVLEEIYTGGRTFDAIFLCRSDAQMPPHLDRYFAKLCSMINGHFTQVEMEAGIDQCRNYWQYIGVSEENNGQRGKGRKPPKEK